MAQRYDWLPGIKNGQLEMATGRTVEADDFGEHTVNRFEGCNLVGYVTRNHTFGFFSDF